MRKQWRWRVTRIRANKAELVGTVPAADKSLPSSSQSKNKKSKALNKRRLAARLEDA